MKTEDLTAALRGASNNRKVLFAAVIGIALLLLTGGFIQYASRLPAGLPDQVSPTPTASLAASAGPVTPKPVYHKKELVFKRTLAEGQSSAVRTSALSDGYKALSVIPPAAVAPQGSFRLPQFPDSSILKSYQTLSTLGTQQYFSNINVQQFLTSLSTQQYLNNLNTWENNLVAQQRINSLNTQAYLNNLNTWMNNLSTQQFLNNFNNQQYLNNFNSYNNFNSFNNFNSYNNFNSFTNPTFIQPRPIYIPPPVYIPPPTFNFRP